MKKHTANENNFEPSKIILDLAVDHNAEGGEDGEEDPEYNHPAV
jgi:hypothetical protein